MLSHDRSWSSDGVSRLSSPLIEEWENRKDVLSEEIEGEKQRVLDEKDANNSAVCLEGQLKNIDKSIGLWTNMLVDAERDLQEQRKHACETTKQKMDANNKTPAIVSIANAQPREPL